MNKITRKYNALFFINGVNNINGTNFENKLINKELNFNKYIKNGKQFYQKFIKKKLGSGKHDSN